MPNLKLPSIFPKIQPQSIYASSKLYECKTRFSLIGSVGSGKSTTVGLMGITTQTLSAIDPSFVCRILERNSNIYGDMSNIRSGHFPEKTVAFDSFATEAGILLSKKYWRGTKKIQIPVCDVAGEDLQFLIRQYRDHISTDLGNAAFNAAKRLTDYVKESEGIIVIEDASRAIIGRRGEQLKSEDDKHLHKDPDVNLVRILNDIFDYKDQIKKPLKAILIVITKWDELKDLVEPLNLNILRPDQRDLILFMDTCFPSVSQAIKSYQNDHPDTVIRYFPTYVEVERNADNTPKTWDKEGKQYKIKPKQSHEIMDLRKPSYSEQIFADLVYCLLGFAN